MSRRQLRKNQIESQQKGLIKKIIIVCLIITGVFLLSVGLVAAKLYLDIRHTAKTTYQPAQRTTQQLEGKRTQVVDLKKAEPFSVLLLGIDSGGLGRTDHGRTDSMILATVNPIQRKTTLVSLERDVYTPIIGHGTTEKLNAAYAYGGVGMAMDTIQNLLTVPIDHYIMINLEGLVQLVDAVGGVSVSNELSFEYEGTSFPIGLNVLDGEQALRFSRMRYDDPDGDYGRQKRQRLVIEGIAKKLLSINSMGHYQSILEAMRENVTTDLNYEDMKELTQNYRDSFVTIEQEQLRGEGFMQDGISYQRVSENELNRINTILKEQLPI